MGVLCRRLEGDFITGIVAIAAITHYFWQRNENADKRSKDNVMPELNTISLDSAMKETLYRNHLYQIDAESKKELPKTSAIPMQGEMRKQILWLIRNEKTPEIQESEMLLLHKILNACKLVPDDIGLIQLNTNPIPIEKIIDTIQPQIVFLSGINETETSVFGNASYELQQQGSIQFIQTDALEIMNTDQSLRARFWNALRQLFNL